MTKTNSSRKLKKISAFFAAVLMCISCLCINASAVGSDDYTIVTNDVSSGPAVWQNKGKVEYTRINITCNTSSAKAILKLYKKWWLGDVSYPDNQEVKVGYGRRTWWNVDQNNSAEYYITAVASNNLGKTMTFVGEFFNF